MNHCKDCRWWDRQYQKTPEVVLENAGVCRCPSIIHGQVDVDYDRNGYANPGVGTAQNFRNGRFGVKPENIGPSDAIVDGYEGVQLDLVTGPEFGCVHWCGEFARKE